MVILRPAVAVAVMQVAAIILGFLNVRSALTLALREVQIFIMVLSSIQEFLGLIFVDVRLDSLDSRLPHTVSELWELRLTICGLTAEADIRELVSTSELWELRLVIRAPRHAAMLVHNLKTSNLIHFYEVIMEYERP